MITLNPDKFIQSKIVMKQSMLHAACLAALLCGTLSGSSAEVPVTDGLVAQWEFDESSGLTASDSVSGNNGDLINFAGDDSHWVPGRNGGAIAFDGTTHIEVPDDPSIGGDITSSMTVMTWFKSNVQLAASGAGNRMLEKSNSYFLLQGVANGGMNFLVKDAGANRTAGIGETLEADVWYHIAGVVDETEIRVYINGVLKNTVTISGPIDDAQLPLFIGSDDSGNHFNGLMDQLLIYNRAVSEAEIGEIITSSQPQGAPVVTTDPQPTTVFEGSTLSLSVVADGEQPLRYLWYRGGEILRSQTTERLTITDVTVADAGDYSVVVSNDVGETRSSSANVSVTPVTGLDTGRVAYWSFDESSGSTAADGSSNSNDGELLGFAGNGFSSAQVNNGLEFDGFGTFVAVNDSDSLNQITSEASIAFWVNLSAYGEIEDVGNYTRASSYILRKGNHLGVRIVNDPGTVTRTFTVRAGDGNDGGGVARSGWELNAPQG